MAVIYDMRRLKEGWWRLFRCDALADQSFANHKQIAQSSGFEGAYLKDHRRLFRFLTTGAYT